MNIIVGQAEEYTGTDTLRLSKRDIPGRFLSSREMADQLNVMRLSKRMLRLSRGSPKNINNIHNLAQGTLRLSKRSLGVEAETGFGR